MTESFEYRGKWWIPDKPDDIVAGIIKYSPGKRITLELIGTFKQENHQKELLKPEEPSFSPKRGKSIYQFSGPKSIYGNLYVNLEAPNRYMDFCKSV